MARASCSDLTLRVSPLLVRTTNVAILPSLPLLHEHMTSYTRTLPVEVEDHGKPR